MFATTDTSAGFVLAAEHGIFLAARADIADALAKCFGAAGLILTEEDVCADFFVLGSGLAGETFQKFTNYRVPFALVISDFGRYGPRFAELAQEHAAHRAIRFFRTVEEARAWLISQDATNAAA